MNILILKIKLKPLLNIHKDLIQKNKDNRNYRKIKKEVGVKDNISAYKITNIIMGNLRVTLLKWKLDIYGIK